MHTEGMQANILMGYFDDAMQNAATGAREYRDINIFPTGKGVHTENGVAVITLAVNGIAAVGEVWPGLVGQVFKMGLVGIGKPLALGLALDRGAVYLLQENNIGTGFRYPFTHGIQYEAA